MNQETFEKKHRQEWERFEQWQSDAGKRQAPDTPAVAEIPYLFRQVCHHLALAKQRMYSPYLVARLNRLVLGGHAEFYRNRAGMFSRILHFILVDFPATVRQEYRLMTLSVMLFFGSLITIAVLIQYWPDLAYSILSEKQMADFEYMYRPDASHFGRNREATSNFQMFGFYIFNNITISFRVFASGMLLGLGTIFYLLFNGIYMGAIVGYLLRIGYGVTIMSFTAGHGSFELTAIAIAGCAGFKLGFAIVKPGRYSRTEALKKAARTCVTLIWGVIGMLLIAAFIEAYWSSMHAIKPQVKYIVGGALWLLVISYFLFAGRGYETR